MRTSILRIDAFDGSRNGYPVALHAWPPPAQPASPIAEALIPGDLKLPGMAKAADIAEIRDCLAQSLNPSLPDIGIQLYMLLAQGAVGTALEGPGQRVVLDIVDDDLRRLPWELLLRPTDGFPQFGDLERPFCRGRLRAAQVQAPHEWPLRIMIAIGASPTDSKVSSCEEREMIVAALRDQEPDIDLLIWRRHREPGVPAITALANSIRDFSPHILHFIGHGQAPPGQQARLEVFNEATKSNEYWDPQAIRTAGLPKSLRLVVINACRSSEDSHTPAVMHSGMWSVTDAFLEAGVPSVLGMRSDVQGKDAAQFGAAFYEALISGKALDVAVAGARQAVRQAYGDGPQRREWASPCLEVRHSPESILNIKERVSGYERQQILSLFSANRSLVDRWPERRQAWQNVGAEQQNVLVIRGRSDVGKTGLAKLLMERCTLFGHYVHYIDLAFYMSADSKNRPGDFLTVLRAMRDPRPDPKGFLDSPAGIWLSPLPQETFAAFNREINRALEVAPPAGQEDEDQGALLTPKAYGQADGLFRSFRACLEQSVPDKPLTVILDHLQELTQSDFTNYLAPHLLGLQVDPHRLGTRLYGRDIRFVLLLTGDQYEHFRLEPRKSRFYLLDVNAFSPEDFPDLAMEFVRRNRLDYGPDDFRTARQMLETADVPRLFFGISGPWNPDVLIKLEVRQ